MLTVARKTFSDVAGIPWLRKIRNIYSRLEHDANRPLTWSYESIELLQSPCLLCATLLWHNWPQNAEFGEITQNDSHYAPIFVPMESHMRLSTTKVVQNASDNENYA